ncbi:MAG: UTP--glucose-1-phosphate uridylyltransferase GalU, partial [Proteobacteria bacterium]
MQKIRKAVIPAAGLGTRFLPATKSIPKEMIPIVDTPMIQLIVEEAVNSGIEEIVLITARNKGEIEDHFDYAFEVETTLDRKGKSELADVSRRIAKMCNIISIRQKNPLGLGHAVLCAQAAIGDEPFVVLLGDDLVDSKIPCTKQLIDIYQKRQTSVVGVMEVPVEDTSKYGIVAGKEVEPGTWKVDLLIEKPVPGQTESRLAIPGRYVLSPQIFDCLRRTKPGSGGEIQLTDALQLLAREHGLYAHQFEGVRYDTGDRVG